VVEDRADFLRPIWLRMALALGVIGMMATVWPLLLRVGTVIASLPT
jgi:hypothetical protein